MIQKESTVLGYVDFVIMAWQSQTHSSNQYTGEVTLMTNSLIGEKMAAIVYLFLLCDIAFQIKIRCQQKFQQAQIAGSGNVSQSIFLSSGSSVSCCT